MKANCGIAILPPPETPSKKKENPTTPMPLPILAKSQRLVHFHLHYPSLSIKYSHVYILKARSSLLDETIGELMFQLVRLEEHNQGPC
jgi:hypothetical protein